MKYVKLFENWLNEAEGAKPFDPSNPGATMVVDLTPKDVFKDAKTAATTIESIINKAVAKKDEPDVPQVYKVELFKFVKPDGIGRGDNDGLKRRAQVQNLETKKIYSLYSTSSNDFMNFYSRFSNESLQETPFFIVSKVGTDYTFESKTEEYKKYPHIRLKKKEAFVLIPDYPWEDYSTDKVDFLTSFKLDGIDTNSFELKGNTISIRGLISYMSNDIDFSQCERKGISELKTPQAIAQFFGYEIPKNYAPGQGVEKKKA